MRAFCEPVTTTSAPQPSVSSGTAPRLETASTIESAPASRARGEQRLEVAHDTRRRLGVDEEHGPSRRSRRARSRRSSARGASPQAYASGTTSQPSARAIALPALAELSLRDGEHALAGREEVDDRRLEGARARGREHEHLVLRAEHLAQPLLRDARTPRRSRASGGGAPAAASARSTSGGTEVGPGVRSFCGRATHLSLPRPDRGRAQRTSVGQRLW